MLRIAGILLVVFLLPVLVLPGPALAWHDASAVIEDVRYVNENGGVTFHVDFEIWGHMGYAGSVRIRISDGYDTVEITRTFQPGYDRTYYRAFSLFVSNTRLAGEGAFITRDLDVTVDILDTFGRVLARDGGVMSWALGMI